VTIGGPLLSPGRHHPCPVRPWRDGRFGPAVLYLPRRKLPVHRRAVRGQRGLRQLGLPTTLDAVQLGLGDTRHNTAGGSGEALGHGGRDDRRRVQLVGFRSADCSGGIPRDPRARRAIIDRVWKIERLRMLSPGLEDNCSSSARNRLPNRSSLNSHSASSRSTHVSGDFASAIEACRRLRTVSFAIQHRVKVAHGSFVSHLRELLARIICKSLKIIRKLWVIESTPVRLPCTSTVVACSL
jgi:hypothetical protein